MTFHCKIISHYCECLFSNIIDRHLCLSRIQLLLFNFVSLPDFSCALVADILLQGHLYITENYFAFYSNVFGYVTKVCQVCLE